MAAYDYRCRICDETFEVRRAVTDPSTEVRCPAGHGDVARLWSAVALTGATSASSPSRPTPGAGACCGGGCCG